MSKVGGDQRALAVILGRIVSDKQQGIKILRDHPETADRIRAINAVAVAGPASPILDAAEWNALKHICTALPADVKRAAVTPAPKAQDNGSAAHR